MTLTLPQGLFRRGNTYSVRYTVPSELQPVAGRREIVKSLGTSDLKEALAKRREALDDMHFLFRDERSRARYVFECIMGLTWPCTKGFLEKRELYQRFDDGWTSGELTFLSGIPLVDVDSYRDALCQK